MLGRNPKTSYLYKAKMKYRDWSPHTVLKGDSVGQFSQYLYGDRLNSRLLHGYVLNFVEYLFVRCRLCTVGRERAIVLPTKPGPKFRNKRRCVVGPSQSRVSGSRHACIFWHPSIPATEPSVLTVGPGISKWRPDKFRVTRRSVEWDRMSSLPSLQVLWSRKRGSSCRWQDFTLQDASHLCPANLLQHLLHAGTSIA